MIISSLSRPPRSTMWMIILSNLKCQVSALARSISKLTVRIGLAAKNKMRLSTLPQRVAASTPYPKVITPLQLFWGRKQSILKLLWWNWAIMTRGSSSRLKRHCAPRRKSSRRNWRPMGQFSATLAFWKRSVSSSKQISMPRWITPLWSNINTGCYRKNNKRFRLHMPSSARSMISSNKKRSTSMKPSAGG